MSLLEDVFLQDEANEAEELERVIEGDEFEERRRSDSDENSEKEDEAEEDRRKVDPSKPKAARVIKNPRVLLNPARLTGPRGIQIIPDHFKDFKFKGKGHEKEDLDLVLKKLEHWAYRLYPKFQFEDCLKKIETLGKKRPVAVHLHKIRSDQFLSEDTVVQKDSSDEDTPMPVQEEDEFDKLLKQQIELARSTPAPSSAKKLPYNSFSPAKGSRTSSLMMPKATSSPSINEEQRERMLRSRKLAEERRLARLKNAANNNIPEFASLSQNTEAEITAQKNAGPTKINGDKNQELDKDTDEVEIVGKNNRSNVIESSDDETIVETNVSIAVDVHTAYGNVTEDNNIDTVGTNTDLNGEIRVTEATIVNNVENDEAMSTSNDNNSNKSTVQDNTAQYNNDENGISCENIEKYDELNFATAVDTDLGAVEDKADNSGTNEELRYDDSDVNIDVNNESITDKSIENTNESPTGNAPKNDIIEDNSNRIVPDNAKVPICTNENEVLASEEVIDDIMDVDFSEDF